MKKFALISNDGCAFNKALRERFGVDGLIIGNITYPDGSTVKADPEYEKVSPEAYFGSMSKDKAMYKTASANVDEIYEVMKEQAKKGLDILAIIISSALSATYNFSLKAKERIEKDYPNIKVYIVDSKRYSTAIGSLLVEANQLREEGKNAQEAYEWIESHKNRIHQIGIMDDLFFLARAGRISKAKAFMGNLVGVEPMADFASNGLSEVIGKGKGKRKSLLAAVSYMKQTIAEPEKHIVFVCHSLREKEAAFLAEEIQKQIAPKEIIINVVDQTSGANMGPGLACAYYYGEPLSEDLSKEKEIIAGILK